MWGVQMFTTWEDYEQHSIYCNNAACTDDLHKLEGDANCIDILAAICESGQESLQTNQEEIG